MASAAEMMQNVVNAAAKAAQAAATAARTLEEMARKKGSGSKFGEAGKVVRMPEPFGCGAGDLEIDQAKWPDFRMAFTSWLLYADSNYENELDTIEKDTKTVLNLNTMNAETRVRSQQLYSILTGTLRGRPCAFFVVCKSVTAWKFGDSWLHSIVLRLRAEPFAF